MAGDKTGKAKLDQAKKFGAKVIDEKTLDAMLQGEAVGETQAGDPAEGGPTGRGRPS